MPLTSLDAAGHETSFLQLFGRGQLTRLLFTRLLPSRSKRCRHRDAVVAVTQSELTEKRKQMAGYLAAYKEVKAELRDRDAVIAELQEKLLPSSQPPTPAKTHGDFLTCCSHGALLSHTCLPFLSTA